MMTQKSVVRKLKGAKGKPILIAWHDAYVPEVDWILRKKIPTKKPCPVITVGFYVACGAGQVWVSQAIIPSTKHHSFPFAIPIGCIVSVKIL